MIERWLFLVLSGFRYDKVDGEKSEAITVGEEKVGALLAKGVDWKTMLLLTRFMLPVCLRLSEAVQSKGIFADKLITAQIHQQQ